jgi:hypothetical protein
MKLDTVRRSLRAARSKATHSSSETLKATFRSLDIPAIISSRLMKSTFISLNRFFPRPDLDLSKRDHTTQPKLHFCEYAAFQIFPPPGHRIGRGMLSGKGKALESSL